MLKRGNYKCIEIYKEWPIYVMYTQVYAEKNFF